jgi:glycosyltransferase involved in cell wall biosynthesis
MERVIGLSVVIPAYNRPEMVRRAVRSALGQVPCPPAEVIVVDDCSTDDTAAAAADAGATVIRHERNRGEGAARNTGLAAATQPWVGLLDSDDEWMPHLLSTLWPRRGRHALVAGAALNCGEDPAEDRIAGPLGRRPFTLDSPARLLYPENFIPASGVIADAEAIRAAGGYDTSLGHAADLDIWLRMLERGTALMVPEVVVRYHLHSGQVTQDHRGMASAQLAVLRSYSDRPWWSRARVEAWRGTSAWDDLRRERSGGAGGGTPRHALFIARSPARLLGVIGIWVRRFRLRRRSAVLIRARGARRPAAAQ